MVSDSGCVGKWIHKVRTDLTPVQLHATVLDEGIFVCVVRMRYRLLASAHEVQARRKQRTHAQFAVPRLVTKHSNHPSAWAVTDLIGVPTMWSC